MAFNSEIDKLERRWLENPLGLTFAPLAEAYRKGGDTAKALELLEIGLAQHPNYVPAHIVRGRCHLDTQSDGAAERAFLKVTELDPENVIAFRSLAELAERAGRLDDAVTRLEALLDVDRNNEEARGQLDRLRELRSAPPTPESFEEKRVSGGQKRVSGGWREFALEEAAAALDPEARRPVGDSSLEDIKLYDPAELTPAESTEYQSSSDAETLRPSEDRLEDVVIGLGVPLNPAAPQPVESTSEPAPFVVEAQPPIVDVVPPPPPMSFEEPTLLPPPPFEEPVREPVREAANEPAPAPGSAAEPEYEPAEMDVGETEAEPALEPEPEPIASQEEPELVVTETMAEIFLRQGHRELAQAVYSQLLLRDPENRRIAAALADLQTASDAAEPTRRHAASATGGRSVEQLFAALLAAVRPNVASPVHPPAFESSRRTAGEPTRPAQDALRLSAVFGEEAAPSGPASAPPDSPPAEPSFDEFFPAAEGSAGDVELPKAPRSEGSAAPAQVPEDLEQFNAWLRGLKR